MVQSNGSTEWELRIEADTFDGMNCALVAPNFRMNNEPLRYSMNWDNVSASKAGLVIDWNYHKSIPFNTLDNRGGLDESNRCVHGFKGRWWYVNCITIFLNGEYENQVVQSFTSMSVYSFKYNVALERSRMMFRPQHEVRLCNNPCKNGGTCEYNVATKSGKCRCTAEFSGPTCEGTDKYTLSTIIGGVLLVSILIAGAILNATQPSEPHCYQLNQRYATPRYMDQPHYCNEQLTTKSQPRTDVTGLSEVLGTKERFRLSVKLLLRTHGYIRLIIG